MIKLTSNLTIIFLIFAASTVAMGQTTEFTFQGRLLENTMPATASYDFEFRLYDAESNGNQLGAISQPAVPVNAGVFSVRLDFGTQFDGTARFIEIAVRPAGVPDPPTVMTPRQPISSTPYAIRSLNAASAETAANASQLGGVDAKEFVQDSDPRMTDARPPTSGSGSYIQNQNAVGQAGNFRINGTGQSNWFNAIFEYRIGGLRALSTTGGNTFVGLQAGQNTTGPENVFVGRWSGLSTTTGAGNTFVGTFSGQANTGSDNTFMGRSAGMANATGGNNSFFGAEAGRFNTSGFSNAFFGHRAGLNNTTAGSNSFFGSSAGAANTEGSHNSFFGREAGEANVDGIANSFFGYLAGRRNFNGDNNAFFGESAGESNTIGIGNAFFGKAAGHSNITGNRNSALGIGANVGASNLSDATAIGAGAIVTASNRIQLGRNGQDTVSIGSLAAATNTNLCINGTVLASCSSSARYKENVRPFGSGLSIIRDLRPVRFDWIGRDEPDLGLIAEEVERVDPLLVTYNQNGEIQGVKYDRIGVVLINVVKEQQEQIEAQQKQIEEQEEQIRAMRSILCELMPGAKICSN